MENNVDPDQMAFQKPADLDLQCFHNKINLGLAVQVLMVLAKILEIYIALQI